ncbi:MAG: basic amino acid ABC transporter substrate-binding protein [Actinomycetota bacterium]|jgi:ABC-type amino acid transport substrate-binding protein|nr:basic amino acid ABC transporter substrate-binding protein [Actinomycetota bacterium]
MAALVFAVVVFAAACGGEENGGETTAGGDTMDADAVTETITVASDISYRPFAFSESEEPEGFDIDLMNEIGERAGFTPEYQNTTFDDIIDGLRSNFYDAAISAMTITEEREQKVDFSDPYFNADQSLLVPSDSGIESTDDLAGASVGVQLGTTGVIEARELEDEGEIAEVRTFDTIEDAFAALENGRVDAVISDLPVSQEKADTSNGELEVVQTIPTGEQYGIAFPEDSDLVGPTNKALEEIKKDGTYEKLYKKWIGTEPEEIP